MSEVGLQIKLTADAKGVRAELVGVASDLAALAEAGKAGGAGLDLTSREASETAEALTKATAAAKTGKEQIDKVGASADKAADALAKTATSAHTGKEQIDKVGVSADKAADALAKTATSAHTGKEQIDKVGASADRTADALAAASSAAAAANARLAQTGSTATRAAEAVRSINERARDLAAGMGGAVSVAAAKTRQSLDGVSSAAARATAALDTASKGGVAAGTAGARGLGRFSAAAQQAGYQIGDFAVQVSSGQNALIAFLQQGTQLLQFFGPWGAIIGAAGAVVGGLAVGLMGMGDAAANALDPMDAFGRTAASQIKDIEELAAKYRSLTAAQANLERVNLLASQKAAVREYKAALDELKERIEDSIPRAGWFDFRDFSERLKPVTDVLAEMKRGALGADEGLQALDLALRRTGLSGGFTAEAVLAAAGKVGEAGATAEKSAEALEFFGDVIRGVHRSAGDLGTTTPGLASFIEKAAEAKNAAPAMRELAEAMRLAEGVKLTGQAVEAFTNGLFSQAQFDAVYAEIQRFIAEGDKAFEKASKGAETFTSALDNQRAKLTEVIDGYIRADSAAGAYYESITLASQKLTSTQAAELAGLKNLGAALKALQAGQKQLDSAAAAVSIAGVDGEIAKLAKLANELGEYRKAVADAQAAVDAASLSEERRAASQVALESAMQAASAAQDTYAAGLKHLSENINAQAADLEFKNRLAALEAQGYDSSSQAVRDLIRERELHAIALERETTLAALNQKLLAATPEEYEAVRAQIEATKEAYGRLYEAKEREQVLRGQKRLSNDWAEVWKNAAAGVQRTLKDTFRDALDGNIRSAKDFAVAFQNIMKDAAAEIAAAMVFKPTIGAVMGSFGAPGSGGAATGGGAQGGGGIMGGFQLPPGLGDRIWGSIFGGGTAAATTTGMAAAGGGLASSYAAGGLGVAAVPGGVSNAMATAGTASTYTGVGTATATGGAPSGLFGTGMGQALPYIGLALQLGAAFMSGDVKQIVGTGGGMAAGAAIGSIFPGIGTLTGAAIGGLLGSLGAGLFGGGGGAGNNQIKITEGGVQNVAVGEAGTSGGKLAQLGRSVLQSLRQTGNTFGGTLKSDAYIGGIGYVERSNEWWSDRGREGSAEQAVKYVLKRALTDPTVWTGLSDDVATAMKRSVGKPIETVLANIEFAMNFDATNAAMKKGYATPEEVAGAQAAAQVKATVAQIEAYMKKTRQLGLSMTEAREASQQYVLMMTGLKDAPKPLGAIDQAIADIRARGKELPALFKAVGLSAGLAREAVAVALRRLREDVQAATAAAVEERRRERMTPAQQLRAALADVVGEVPARLRGDLRDMVAGAADGRDPWGAYRGMVRRLDGALAAGRIGLQDYADAVANITALYDRAVGVARPLAEAIAGAIGEARGQLRDARLGGLSTAAVIRATVPAGLRGDLLDVLGADSRQEALREYRWSLESLDAALRGGRLGVERYRELTALLAGAFAEATQAGQAAAEAERALAETRRSAIAEANGAWRAAWQAQASPAQVINRLVPARQRGLFEDVAGARTGAAALREYRQGLTALTAALRGGSLTVERYQELTALLGTTYQQATQAAAQAAQINLDSRVRELRGAGRDLAADLLAFDTRAKQEVAQAAVVGANVVRLERVLAAERLALIEQHNERVLAEETAAHDRRLGLARSLTEWLDRQRIGDASSLSSQDRLVEAQRLFAEAMAAARGGDEDAVGKATGYADAILSLGRDLYASGAQYTALEAMLRSQLEKLGKALDLPGFAAGGWHAGGLRIVGENGPELEATGPARIYSARETAAMLRQAAPAPAAVPVGAAAGDGAREVVRAVAGSTAAMIEVLEAMLEELREARREADMTEHRKRLVGGRATKAVVAAS